jgi:hypothetical protein
MSKYRENYKHTAMIPHFDMAQRQHAAGCWLPLKLKVAAIWEVAPARKSLSLGAVQPQSSRKVLDPIVRYDALHDLQR